MLFRPFLYRFIFCASLFLIMTNAVVAQTYRYRLNWDSKTPYTYFVELETEKAEGSATDFKIPAWRPGRYMLQDYAAAINFFEATDEKNKPLAWSKTDKDTWRVTNPSGGKIKIKYRFYNQNLDAGTSVVNDDMVYFNGSNLFMYVNNRLDAPCTLEMPNLPKNYKAATGLTKGKKHNEFSAQSYHNFIDCPSVFSPTLKQFEFDVKGLKCYAHFQGKYGAPDGAEKTLIENLTKIIEAQYEVFRDFPTKDYHFIYLLVPFQMRHAVEHLNSAMFAMPESVAASAEAFGGLYGISSHEFWHLWNVKTIRPAAMWPYDYSKPAYTRLHWFTEGVTDYYAYLMLARAGVISRQKFFDFIAGDIGGVENNYAAKVVSAEMMSFDTWLTTSPYANPYERISFYTAGTRIGYLLDIHLRTLSNGKVSLDNVFQYLYVNYYKKNLGVPEDGVQKACETLTGKSLKEFFDIYVAGFAPFDDNKILKPFGLEVVSEPKPEMTAWEKIGVKRGEGPNNMIYLERVTPLCDAYHSGLQEDDLIAACNGAPCTEADFKNLNAGDKVKLTVVRGEKTLEIELKFTGQFVPKKFTLRPIEGADTKAIDQWLGIGK